MNLNSAHLHLLITHLPVLGDLFGLLMLLIALAKGDRDLKRISLFVFMISAMAAVPTYLTGRTASTFLMKLMPGMSMDAGDQHAEVAVIALAVGCVLGIVALAGLLVYRQANRTPTWFTGLVLVLALLTTAVMTWTANLGGKIRHVEIQSESNLPVR
jgi:uncharacterized membrane protein